MKDEAECLSLQLKNESHYFDKNTKLYIEMSDKEKAKVKERTVYEKVSNQWVERTFNGYFTEKYKNDKPINKWEFSLSFDTEIFDTGNNCYKGNERWNAEEVEDVKLKNELEKIAHPLKSLILAPLKVFGWQEAPPTFKLYVSKN